MAMASDMATTMACPTASSSTWSQLKARYSRKLLISCYHHPFVDRLATADQDDPEESTTPSRGSEDQPSRAESSSAALLTSRPAASRRSPKRNFGAETLSAATIRPLKSRTGAATPTKPNSNSSSTTAYPP